MLCCSLVGRAQESFEDFPISPLTGQVSSRFYTAYKAPSKKPGIKFITFCSTYALGDGRPDTTLHYQLFLAPDGSLLGSIWAYIPDEHYLAASVVKNGKLIRAYCRKPTGGGFEMPFITTNFYTDYIFKKGRLTSEEDGSVQNSRGFSASPLPHDPKLIAGGPRIDYTYNRRRQMETATATQLTDSGTRTFYNACSYYRYDKDGRRILDFNLDIKDLYAAPRYDTLTQLPDSFGKILIRNFATAMGNITIPGIEPRDTDEDDEDSTMAARNKLQDSPDQKEVDAYMRQAIDVAVYEYDSKGRPSGRLQFHEDDLEVKETFYYDAVGRCVGWHSIDLGGNGIHTYSRMDREWQSVGNTPSLSDWTFEYDARNRVNKAVYKAYGNSAKYRYSLKEATELTLEKVYELVYRDDGLLGQIHLITTVPTRTYGPTDSKNFTLRYDRY